MDKSTSFSEGERDEPEGTTRNEHGELQEGSIVAGRYEVTEFKIEGGMARIYRVLDRRTNEPCILKECANSSSEEDRKRFVREVSAMRKIDHPNVMSILDSDLSGPAPYFVMASADGDLDQFAEGIRRSELGVFGAFLEVCRGVCAIHAAGTLHRDLKPENILRLDGRWVVSDLGLATRSKHTGRTEKLTVTNAIMGTPGYIAPELQAGHNADERADVFSLGRLLHQLLTGSTQGWIDDDAVSEPVKEILLRATSANPDARYASVEELMSCVQSHATDLLGGSPERVEGHPAVLPGVTHMPGGDSAALPRLAFITRSDQATKEHVVRRITLRAATKAGSSISRGRARSSLKQAAQCIEHVSPFEKGTVIDGDEWACAWSLNWGSEYANVEEVLGIGVTTHGALHWVHERCEAGMSHDIIRLADVARDTAAFVAMTRRFFPTSAEVTVHLALDTPRPNQTVLEHGGVLGHVALRVHDPRLTAECILEEGSNAPQILLNEIVALCDALPRPGPNSASRIAQVSDQDLEKLLAPN